MGAPFWIRRYFVAFVVAAAVIGGAQILKGRTLRYAVAQGVIWGIFTAGVYIATAIYRFRTGQHCAVCNIPETAHSRDSSPQS